MRPGGRWRGLLPLIELGNLLCPAGGILVVADGFTAHHEAAEGVSEQGLGLFGHAFALGGESLAAGEQQRFAFGGLLLSELSGTEKAFGVKAQPVAWGVLDLEVQPFA